MSSVGDCYSATGNVAFANYFQSVIIIWISYSQSHSKTSSVCLSTDLAIYQIIIKRLELFV